MIKSRTGFRALFRIGLGSRPPSFSSGHILLRSLIFPQNSTLGLAVVLTTKKKMRLLFFSLIAGHSGTSPSDFIDVQVTGTSVSFVC